MSLIGIVNRFERPYTLSPEKLLSICKEDIYTPHRIDSKKLVEKAKLSNSPSSDFNMKYWQNMIYEEYLPLIGGTKAYQSSEEAQSLSVLICIGLFHNEEMIDSDYTQSDIFKASLIYASKLMCPEQAVLSMMKRKASPEELMMVFGAPKLCVMTSIKNVLAKNGYKEC